MEPICTGHRTIGRMQCIYCYADKKDDEVSELKKTLNLANQIIDRARLHHDRIPNHDTSRCRERGYCILGNALHNYDALVPNKTITITREGLCDSKCGTPCPLGRIGAQNRCTRQELVDAGIEIREETG